MGLYINPGNEGFRIIRNSEYIDKSGLISRINRTIDTSSRLTLVSRPRRFGKSYAAKMLCAYYDRSCDSRSLFDDIEVAKDNDYDKFINKFNILFLDIAGTQSKANVSNLISNIRKELIREYNLDEADDLAGLLNEAVEKTGCKFIAIIDEWDYYVRDKGTDESDVSEYLDFLRFLFKNNQLTDKIFAAAYMTGILPMKKDGSQSAISEFNEYTVLNPNGFAEYTGFTEENVRALCEKHDVDFESMKKWYDGYRFHEANSIYNPSSVMKAIINGEFTSYWSQSTATDALVEYINMDFDGLQSDIIKLISGESVPISIKRFKNDLVSFKSKDDVLTVLTHFGYLNYDPETRKVRIPNEEVKEEFEENLHQSDHKEIIKRIKDSEKLIRQTIEMDEDAVALEIERIHTRETTPIHYNNEQALRHVVKTAYFACCDDYLCFEELPSGKGFVDIVYLPKKGVNSPILLIELKFKDTVSVAIDQIKNHDYPQALRNYGGEILLVGISYDPNSPVENRRHDCSIVLENICKLYT